MDDDFDDYLDDASFDAADLQQLDQAESQFNADLLATQAQQKPSLPAKAVGPPRSVQNGSTTRQGQFGGAPQRWQAQAKSAPPASGLHNSNNGSAAGRGVPPPRPAAPGRVPSNGARGYGMAASATTAADQEPNKKPRLMAAPQSGKQDLQGKGKARAMNVSYDDEMSYNMPSMRYDEAKGTYTVRSPSSPPLAPVAPKALPTAASRSSQPRPSRSAHQPRPPPAPAGERPTFIPSEGRLSDDAAPIPAAAGPSVESSEVADLRAQVACLTSQLDGAQSSLSQVKNQHFAAIGEVSIVRSRLNTIEASSKKEVADAKSREDEWRKKVDELERDIRALRKAEKASNAFKRIEESTKKLMPTSGAANGPPGSVQRNRYDGSQSVQATPSVLLRSVSRPRSSRREVAIGASQAAPTDARGRLQRVSSSDLMPPPPPPPDFGTATRSSTAAVKGKAREKDPQPTKAFGGFMNSFADDGPSRAASRAPSVAPSASLATTRKTRSSRNASREATEELSFVQEVDEDQASPSQGRAGKRRAKGVRQGQDDEDWGGVGWEAMQVDVDGEAGGAAMEVDEAATLDKAGWTMEDDDDDFPRRDISNEILSLLFQHTFSPAILPPPINTAPPPPVAAALRTSKPAHLHSLSATPTFERPEEDVPTLHYLLNLRSPEPPPRWSSLCQQLFACLGNRGGAATTQQEEDDAIMRLVAGVGSMLVKMAEVSVEAEMHEPLSACLSLLNSLCHLVQLFPSLLLNHRDFEPYLVDRDTVAADSTLPTRPIGCTKLLVTLIQSHGLPADVVAKRAAAAAGDGRTRTATGRLAKAGASRMMSLLQQQEIAREKKVTEMLRVKVLGAVLDLVEAMLWDPSEACFSELEMFLSEPTVIAALLHTSQPAQVLRRGIGILTLLACHASLFRSIMNCPMDDTIGGAAAAPGTALINHLAKLLASKAIVEAGTSTARDMSIEILTLLSMLSIKHSDGPVLLCEAIGLVPVLVRIIARDMQVLSSGDGGPGYLNIASTLTRRVDLATALLHYLIFFRGPDDDQLRGRIFDMQQSYPGAHHDFIVAFTRLAYADAPDWLSSEGAGRIDGLTDLAHDLLMAVASPEEVDEWYDCVVERDDEDEDDGPGDESELIRQAETFEEGIE